MTRVPNLAVKPRKREKLRRWFTAEVATMSDAIWITARRGASVQILDDEGVYIVGVRFDSRAILRVNIGDRLVVCGPTVAMTAIVVVRRIEQAGYAERMLVEKQSGDITYGVAQVQPLDKAKVEKKRRRAA